MDHDEWKCGDPYDEKWEREERKRIEKEEREIYQAENQE